MSFTSSNAHYDLHVRLVSVTHTQSDMSFTSSNAHYDLHVRLVSVTHTLIHLSLNHSVSGSVSLSLIYLNLRLYPSFSPYLSLSSPLDPHIFICQELSAPLVPGQPSRLWLTPSTLKYGNQYSQCLNPSVSIHVRPPRPSSLPHAQDTGFSIRLPVTLRPLALLHNLACLPAVFEPFESFSA